MTTSSPQKPQRQPAQTVLVLEGGGALGAYQFGIYRGLHEAGIEPDWVIGTSIGAINAALIAGNPPGQRLERMQAFWERVTHRGSSSSWAHLAPDWARAQQKLEVVFGGLSGFFQPNWAAWVGDQRLLGSEHAAFYSTQALRHTLEGLLDTQLLAQGPTRLTVGAVNARTGQMRYFDNQREALGLDAVMASGALAPAFGAVRIDGEPYWDGGLYSNTPIEVVLDERPHRDALIFSAQLWRAEGAEPQSVAAVQERLKDVQFASRADSHIERHRQMHHLRHTIHELHHHVPASKREHETVREHATHGSDSVVHVVKLRAARLPHDDAGKDVDFSPTTVKRRHDAGLATVRAALSSQPWKRLRGLAEGLCVHEIEPVFS